MTELQIYKGDITTLEADAIVNAANSSLLGGGGVDGAIHRAAGPELLAECRMLNGCRTGEAKITGGHNLNSRYIIHAVGPVWRGGGNNERELLESAYTNVMLLAAANNARIIAFPNISTGVYNFPKQEAAAIAIATVRAFTAKHTNAFDKVIFACFDDENYQLYSKMLNQ